MSWYSSSAASPPTPCAASCKSVCCFWNHLISHPEYQKELPQIAAGFFYRTWKGKCNFASITGEHPSLSFLPFPIHDVVILDCCSGLILCWCFGCRYVVCNPATNKWSLLQDNLRSCGEARLGFDPTVSSHFHVFEYGKMREGESVGVSIYSFKSATWIVKESKWGDNIIVSIYARSMFLNGFIYWLEFSQIVVVDMDGKTWTKI